MVKGRVRITGSGGVERPLEPGDAVAATDQVSTAADSSVSMVLRDGTTVVLGPNTRIVLREFAFNPTTYEGNVLLAVMRGTMRMVSGLVAKNRPESVRVTTPTALIGVRGTDFIVQVDEADGAGGMDETNGATKGGKAP